ncbi:MAG: DUF3394 domain-containing protein, partial [Deltaproteobacteria bacterium]|nr:DUF3394 domain-containing protein [Deltaproteobacteria bacterium]
AAVYAAVAIARSKFWTTGWLAVRMGLAGFVAPFLFVYRPAILLAASPLAIVWESLVSALAVLALAGGAMGYFGDKCHWYENLLLIGGAILLIWPGLITDVIGLCLVVSIYIYQKKRNADAEEVMALSAAQ